MADAAREQMLKQVAADLVSLIDGTGNYEYDLKSVYRDVASLAQLRANLPCAVFIELEEGTAEETTDGDHVDADLTILVYLLNDVAKDAATQLNNMQADLYRAMRSGVNQYHSNTTIMVHYEGADRLSTREAKIIAIETRWRIRYGLKRSEPTSFHN